ncbi:MAG: 2-isopropylmalate synthase [Firmicutes bacterium]|nr:2-isopropylmalate synthase [Bacillota bacterium]
MKNFDRYHRGYFMPPVNDLKWAQKEYIDKAPVWCSVDLRDGNQSLIVPMSLDEKLEFFTYLVKIGFKEIEVGFPAASETEYEFLRALIERDLVPDDVTLQVLTQSREHIIAKTFESLKGVKNAIVHLYNSTSLAQREQVFRMEKPEIIKIATDGAELLKKYAADMPGNIRFEYSPESFTGTEMEFALEICNAVLDVWQPTAAKPVIINLPATVEMSLPHVYASQVEYMSDNLKYRENVVLSLHPHNDRGCGVADSELGILAGADRIEGTLFGNGERTGNVDIVTLAMNMFTHGVDPELDFSDIQEICKVYEKVTRMHVYERQPYSGRLVFAAFSGSHQDAIAKGMKWHEEKGLHGWTVPYLPIDPHDVGREYESDVIRINSQSGKGGIGYLMKTKYGFNMPQKMQEDFGYAVKSVSDHLHKELSHEEIRDILLTQYVNIDTPLSFGKYSFVDKTIMLADIDLCLNGRITHLKTSGNGRLDAVSKAIKTLLGKDIHVLTYEEHALNSGSASQAIAYVGVIDDDKNVAWGAGIDSDIIDASMNALLSAVNRLWAVWHK